MLADIFHDPYRGDSAPDSNSAPQRNSAPGQADFSGQDDGLTLPPLPTHPIDQPIPLGLVLITPGAVDALEAAGVPPRTILTRHEHGDWGEVDAPGRHANDRAAVQGNRLRSVYILPATGQSVWVLTEGDRSATLVLVPRDQAVFGAFRFE